MKEIFNFLKSYSNDTTKVNRLLVSNFLLSNEIRTPLNEFIRAYIITEESEDWIHLKKSLIIAQLTSLEDLVEAFEYVISPEEKIVTGAIYTPLNIREYIIKQIIDDDNFVVNDNLKICDPACGCSGFLLTAAQKIHRLSGITYKEIYQNHIFGLDTQQYSIERSKILLSLAAILEGEDQDLDFNLFQGNALNFNWSNTYPKFKGFSAIVGNPPYVCSRNIDEESKNLLGNWSVCSTGHPDLYIPFFQIGISLLQEGGKLGYITMNTFFKSVNGRALRNYFQNLQLNFTIIDFGAVQIFNSKSTYTCICLIELTTSKNLQYVRIGNYKDFLADKFILEPISYKNLDADQGWNLQEQNIINKIESIGTPLGKKFKSRNGIATLKNTIYIFEPLREDEEFYYLDSKGKEFKIERDACLEVVNPNKLINLNSIDTLRKKIIFPYYIEDKKINIYEEAYFSIRFPFTFEYLLSKKEELASRDKGEGENYDVWYKYGRNQSLEPYTYKLFFPHISPHIPHFVINDEPNLLFVNGLAIVSDSLRDLKYLRKIMSSRLFWFYITNSSKPYGSGYFSLSRNYIQFFGIYDFDEEQMEFLIETDDQTSIDEFLENLYGINLDSIRQPMQLLPVEI